MKAVVRDVLIILGLTFVGGFVVGVAVGPGAHGNRAMIAIGLANILLSVIGYCISGAMAKHNRFNHLFKVAIGVWLISAANMLIMPINIVQWLFSSVVILISMAVGGALSFLFVPNGVREQSAN